jgi:hypothetical protein
VLERTGALIVVPEGTETAVHQAVFDLTGWREADDQTIEVLTIPSNLARSVSDVTKLVRRRIPPNAEIFHVLITRDISVDERKLGEVQFKREPGVKSLLARGLRTAVRELGLNWYPNVVRKLTNAWSHGPLDSTTLEDWLAQFDRLGSHRWVGEVLLKRLDFMSNHHIKKSLGISTAELDGFDCVALNFHTKGKSSSALANIAKKHLDGEFGGATKVPVADFRDALSNPNFARIVFLEDCLITGVEMRRVFNGLMGVEDPKGTVRATKLDNTEVLRNKEIELRFSVTTNFGVQALSQYLKHNSLLNVTIAPGKRSLVTATRHGLEAYESNLFYDEEDCVSSTDFLTRPAFDISLWGTIDQRDRAMKFCSEVGAQLYSQYLEGRNQTWSPRRIAESSLGIQGQALTLAFPHSVPKETLPLFWMQGDVMWDKRLFEWRPLFLNAL